MIKLNEEVAFIDEIIKVRCPWTVTFFILESIFSF